MAKEDIKLRSVVNAPLTTKGSALTHAELDQNFIEIYNQLLSLSTSSYCDAYSNAVEYDNTIKNYVVYGGQLWKFINGTPATDVTPGTDPLTWIKVYATDLVHKKNQDTKLAEGTANEVSSQTIREMVDGTDGTSRVFIKKVTLTSADVLASNTSPFELIQGEIGKVINVLSAAIKTDFNTTPYATNKTVNIYAENSTSNMYELVDALAMDSDGIYKMIPITGNPAFSGGTQLKAGESIFFKTATGNPTAGDSDIIVYLTYTLEEY